jgi:hypothetical protein
MKTKSLLFVLALAMSFTLSAATITVTNGNASGEGSFAQAYTDAVAGDVINFNFDGTEISLAGAVVMKGITINGLNAFNGQKIILKQTTASQAFFTLASGITATFQNLVFDGTGILGNTAITAALGSTLTVEGCTVKNINAQGNNGGAMRIQGVASITNSVFEGNTCAGSYGGGALCIYNDAAVSITGCSFINNTSASTSGTPNRSGGGAIVVRGTGTTGNPTEVSITNSTFANNNSSNFGGALLASVQSGTNYTVNVDLINCTVTGNTGNAGVEVHANSNGTLNLDLINTIVTNNVNASGYNDLLENKEATATATLTSSLYNSMLSVSSVTPGVDRNCIIINDPATANIFKTLETFATDKKRPVLTDTMGHKVAEISSTSIAKEAGVATLTGYTIPTVDQLGATRPATPAIGAVEYDFTNNIIPNQDNQSVKIRMENSTVSFSGLSGEQQINVYGLTGNLLHKGLINNNENLSLGHLNANLVIVRVQNKSFKVMLK